MRCGGWCADNRPPVIPACMSSLTARLLIGLFFANSVHPNPLPSAKAAKTWAELPPAKRIDPLLIRQLYESESRVTPVTVAQCDKLRNKKRNSRGTGLTNQDVEFLAHMSVATPSTPKSRMLCIAFTYKEDHDTKAAAMVSTWMPRCDGAVLLSNESSSTLPAVEVPHVGPESYSNIWQKSRANWKYVYDNYFDEFDWFVFGGTDYYVVVENMRLYLDSNEIQSLNEKGTPLYLGRRFTTSGRKDQGPGQFNSGGPSYVLNKMALKLFVDNLENRVCRPTLQTAGEDVLIADCLRHSGNVLPYDTRDEKHRERFHPFTPGSHMFFKIVDQAAVKAAGKQLDWYTKYSPWGIQTGLDCCSPNSISWHYISPEKLRSLDSLFYACRTPEMLLHFKREAELELAATSTEALFRFLGKHTCQQMQNTWKVCTTERDPNHALAMTNCPVTCSVARGVSMPNRDALRRSFEDKVRKLKMARNH